VLSQVSSVTSFLKHKKFTETLDGHLKSAGGRCASRGLDSTALESRSYLNHVNDVDHIGIQVSLYPNGVGLLQMV